MKHERGLQYTTRQNISKRAISEAIEILDNLLSYFFDESESQKIRQICNMLGDGLSRVDISRELNMSEHEVNRYIKIAEELCASAIMACEDDRFIEQSTIFGDWHDLVSDRVSKIPDTPLTKRKKKVELPLFSLTGG